MSCKWSHIYIVNTPENFSAITEDVAIHFDKKEVVKTIKAHLPEIIINDDSSYYYEKGADAVSFTMRTNYQIMLGIHELEEPEQFIQSLCNLFNCRAFDTTAGEFL